MYAFFRRPEFLLFLVAVWLTLSCNDAAVMSLSTAPDSAVATSLLAGLTVRLALGAIIWFFLILLGIGRAVLATIVLLSGAVAFFVNNLGIQFDPGMLANVLETNPAEASELLTVRFLTWTLFLGVIPAIVVFKYPLEHRSWWKLLAGRAVSLVLAVALLGSMIALGGKDLISAARNHREVRHQIVPVNLILSGYSLAHAALETVPPFRHLALDATNVRPRPNGKPQVFVMMLGETARAANFGLNGYSRNTTPRLAEMQLKYFGDVISCGTSTRTSVPCMFSAYSAEDFDLDRARYEDNLLDIADRAGYRVLWRENRNNCKHVCDRADFKDVSATAPPEDCQGEFCFDKLLVEELDRLLEGLQDDTVVVLHQIGSHGPSYFQRYPEKYRKFVPDCRSADFANCSQQEVINAYDNTILYTDTIIADAIGVLKKHAQSVDPVFMYVSDHGESLGENGLYLHGMPYSLAPDLQTRVPMLFWSAAPGFLQPSSHTTPAGQVSHDAIFHTALGILGIRTEVYDPALDLFRNVAGTAAEGAPQPSEKILPANNAPNEDR